MELRGIGLLTAAILLVALGLRHVLARLAGLSPGKGRALRRERLGLSLGIAVPTGLLLIRVWSHHSPLMAGIDRWLSSYDAYGGGLSTIVAAMVIFVATRLVLRGLLTRTTELSARHKIRRTVTWTSALFFIAITLGIWLRQTTNLGVFLGIIGAGVALSLQETLLCVAGWALVVLQRPFDVGDRIELDGLIGDVIDISVFHTHLLEVGNWVHAEQSTGRLVSLPNSRIFRGVLVNYTKGFPFIWNELQVVVTFESNWRKAKEILLDTATSENMRVEKEVQARINEMQTQYAIYYQKLTPIVYTHVADHGIGITLRYLTPVRRRRSSAHDVWETVLERFREAKDIDFAYPTQRLFYHPREGKEELRGEERGDLPPV